MRTADLCPECARPTEERGVRGGRSVCPHCGSPLERDTQSRWINVARVANLAEAGFLVDELAGEGIDARIYQSEDFSALTDRWQVSYLIQSPPSAAPLPPRIFADTWPRWNRTPIRQRGANVRTTGRRSTRCCGGRWRW